MECVKSYTELLEMFNSDRKTTEDYMKERSEHLKNAKSLLLKKEEELTKVHNYTNLLLNVIQALKLEIASTEYEINALNVYFDSMTEHDKDVEKMEEQKKEFEAKVADGSFAKNETHFTIKVDSLSDLRKQAESLFTVKNEVVEDSVEKLVEEVVEEKTSVDSNNSVELSTSKVVSENKVDKVVKTSDWVQECNSATEDRDYCYLSLVETNCKVPDETVMNIDIWRRRVLIKFYMESGYSRCSDILNRYNKYATKYNAPKATESSVTKDIKRIFEGRFNLDVLLSSKVIFPEFRPSSMLSNEEICKINEKISEFSSDCSDRYIMIERIEEYARGNLSNMSTYKLRAVRSFLDEQFNNK